jgi:hypothetical protein
MLMRPSDLPTVQDAKMDSALRKVTEWKLENSEEEVPPPVAVAFVRDHMASFFQSMRRALRINTHKESAKPTV